MTNLYRRKFLASGAILTGISALGTTSSAAVPSGRDPFDYEITRTENEWREMLGEDYPILREGQTEKQRSSALWAEAREGAYNCRGCDLLQYSSHLKVNLLKGWVFFTSSEPNSQLMSQDVSAVMQENPSGALDLENIKDAFDVNIEVHCRRCGCHMGHILLVDGSVLHCINGASLDFVPDST